MGGQYFRESPRAADISLTEQPDRAVSNTHSVFVRAALPGMCGSQKNTRMNPARNAHTAPQSRVAPTDRR